MRRLNRLRKTTLARVLDVLKRRGARVTDDYPIRLTDVYTEMLAENRSVPVLGEWVRRAARISTRFYRENPREKKAALLAEIEGELEDALGRMKEVRSLSASRNRIFISHSNVFPKILQHYAEVIGRAGYEPVVAELRPNLGKSWHPGQKVKALLASCAAMVAVLTPDDPHTKEPRLNVVHEIGLAQGIPIPIVFLKAKETRLPSDINPVYISFDLKSPAKADPELVRNLFSLGV